LLVLLVLLVFRVLRDARFLRLLVRFFARFFCFAIGLTSSIGLGRLLHWPSSLRPEATLRAIGIGTARSHVT
jgi:hypothetical protein